MSYTQKPSLLVKLNTGHWNISPQGWYPHIAGGDGPEDDNTDDTGDTDQTSERTFTQRDLDRVVAREKKEGKKAAVRELMETFGFDSVEDAKTFFDEAKERGSKDNEDADRRTRKAEERERKAIEREQAAVRRLNETNVLAELISTGLDKAAASRLVKAVNVNLADEDLDTEDITTAVDELRQELPQLFNPVDAKPETPPVNRPGRPVDTTSTVGGRRSASPKSPDQIARELLEQRHARALNRTATRTAS